MSHTHPNSKPKVSIITSVFKGDRYIRPFLEDITRQTIFPLCELILINPHSTTGHEEPVIREYMTQYPNIIYKKLNSDPGLYQCWNLAIQIAGGEYITNANVDDRRSPEHLAKHLQVLEANPDVDVACAAIKVTQGINETWEKNTAYTIWYQEFIQGESAEYSGPQNFFQTKDKNGVKTGKIISNNFPHCMPVWRKQVHDQNGYFDQQKYGTSADWEFWLRCANNGSKFKLIKEPLGLYLEDLNSHNHTYKGKDYFERKILAQYPFQERLKITVKLSNGQKVTYPQKIDMTAALKSKYGNHRSGWGYALQSLKPLHTNLGVWLDGFMEKKFSWGDDPGDRLNNPKPYRQPWIGFTHVPHNLPSWFRWEQSSRSIFATKLWQESIASCKGLFCLSQYHQAWLEKQLDVKVVSLIHPTETPEIKFSFDAFKENRSRKIVQVGWWLRKLHSIYYLPVRKIKKAILRSQAGHVEEMFAIEKAVFNLNPDKSSVERITYLSNNEYDKLLGTNIVYLNLYDTSANNAIIECIVRNTPVLVNPHPAVKEYLGQDYPFYFQDLEEAARKAEDMGLIEETHAYLKSSPIQEKLTTDYFLQSFVESEIYQKLI